MLRARAVGNKNVWFNDAATALNRVLPAFYHDYVSNRFWNSVDGETANPFVAARAGNAMHFDPQGRLVWASANMLVNTTGFTTGWTKQNCSITGATTDPFNGSNGVEITDTTTGAALYSVGGTIASTQNYTLSFFVKRGNTDFFTARFLESGFSNGIRIQMNLVTGELSSISPVGAGVGLTVTATNAGNGWFRVALSGKAGAGGSTSVAEFHTATSLASPTPIVGGTYFVFGPQLEAYGADSPKPYIANAGTAYYTPRIDYDPQTRLVRGYLVEAAKTNIIPISETKTIADWNNGSFSIASYPGDQWARFISRITVTATGAAQFNYINANSVLPTGSTVYTSSAFFKRGNIARVQFTTSANFTDAYLNYNFDTNTITLGGANVVAGSGHAQLLQDGWVRLQYSFTTIAVPVSGSGAIVAFIDSDAAARLGGTATNGAYVDVFGFQVETQGLATSYIPTFGTTATRVADQASLTVGAWLTQNKGTFLLELFSNKRDANLRRCLDLNDGSTNNRIQIARGSGVYTGVSSVAGVSDFNPTSNPAVSDFQVDKVALRYNASGKAILSDAGSVITSAVAPPVTGYTTLQVGHISGFTDGNASQAWIRQVRYYGDDTASTAQLQALTTV